MKIAILQPQIPHYREEFFSGLSEELKFDLFSFKDSSIDRKHLKEASIDYKSLRVITLWRFKLYNPFRFLLKYDSIVIPGEISYLSNWILLFASFFSDKKIFIIGHGLNYKKTKPLSLAYKLMYFFSSGAFFYTEKEMRIYRRIFPNKKFTFLNNTITVDVNKINESYKNYTKDNLRKKYKIIHSKIFISCYRFTNPDREDEKLFKLIKECQIKNLNVGFIIIGVGDLKPNFSDLKNVYDFGELYDSSIKLELFQLSDFYLQLGWTGLSIVEALAHKKPIVTLKRSSEIKQSVEYFYLRNKYNALILNSIDEFDEILELSKNKLQVLSDNAFLTYTNDLKMTKMTHKFKDHIHGE